ncbi:helix-turn-helix domain-containing protein [Streptomyces sp. NBC_00370]|uniref:helix-turn-helix domain-containing protein n=1 Tax=Streptomyces sp. NBC_00370 TaxID=2975728 RepID=UPI002E270738
MTQSTKDSAPAPPLPVPKERRRLREAKSLTAKQVAAALGVTQSTLRGWETGRAAPRGRKRDAYARLLAGYAVELREKEEREAAEVRAAALQRAATALAPAASAPAASAPDTSAPDTSAHTAVAVAVIEPPAVKVSIVKAPPYAKAETAEQAFDALYAYAAPALVRQTYLLTGRRALSQESVERAFHLAWHRWPEVAVDRDPAGWVRAAAYEYALSPWHRLRLSHRRPDPAAAAAEREGRPLREALLRLPPRHRRTLLLYDGLGLDLPETAAETEASTPTAANRLLHAREAVAERVPELADPEELHAKLGTLTRTVAPPSIAPAGAVRTAGERRAKFWTRSAVALTVLIIGATAFTVATAPRQYEPPRAPSERVGGVPQRGGPEQLTGADLKLRERLMDEPMNGPPRLVPEAH